MGIQCSASRSRRQAGARFSPERIRSAERRHTLYLLIRTHITSEALGLPEELTMESLSDIASMAKARCDRRMTALCLRAGQSFAATERSAAAGAA